MLLKKILSLSLLAALAGSAFIVTGQDAEAGRCCRQRCHRSCCNGGYAMNGGYGYSNAGSCSTCNGTSAPATYDGNTTAPAPAPAPAPPPAPTT